MRPLRHLPALIVSIVLPLVASHAIAGAALDRVLASRTLVMSSHPDYPPQSFIDGNNKMAGFDVDVGAEIALRLGVALRIVTPPWEEITAGRWGGRWDISVGSMAPTRERSRVLDFPAVYYFTPAVFAVHVTAGAKDIHELNGKTIGVCDNCTYEAYLQRLLVLDGPEAPPFTFEVTPGQVRTYPSDAGAFDALRQGDGARLDAVLSALPTIEGAIRSGYPMRVLGRPVFYEPLAVAIDKGDPAFAARLREIVMAMHADGTLRGLSMRWYGTDLTRIR